MIMLASQPSRPPTMIQRMKLIARSLLVPSSVDEGFANSVPPVFDWRAYCTVEYGSRIRIATPRHAYVDTRLDHCLVRYHRVGLCAVLPAHARSRHALPRARPRRIPRDQGRAAADRGP